jgi:CRISPR/Cas system CMR-associated protein Cmr5 small subunit
MTININTLAATPRMNLVVTKAAKYLQESKEPFEDVINHVIKMLLIEGGKLEVENNGLKAQLEAFKSILQSLEDNEMLHANDPVPDMPFDPSRN